MLITRTLPDHFAADRQTNMFASSVVLLAFATLGFAFNDTDANYPYTIAAGSLPASTTGPWCVAQQNSCREICGGLASPNDCDSVSTTR